MMYAFCSSYGTYLVFSLELCKATLEYDDFVVDVLALQDVGPRFFIYL